MINFLHFLYSKSQGFFNRITRNGTLAYPLQLSTTREESHWYYADNNRLTLVEFSPNDVSSSYRFVLHIMPPLHDWSTSNDEAPTKVCIECLSCHDVQLNVEILSPEEDKSVVYTVSDYSHLEDSHLEDEFSPKSPKSQTCSVGLLCSHSCNIILTYRGILPFKQCGCTDTDTRLTIVATRKADRKKQAASVTSVKRKRVSKISNM